VTHLAFDLIISDWLFHYVILWCCDKTPLNNILIANLIKCKIISGRGLFALKILCNFQKILLVKNIKETSDPFKNYK